MTQTADAYFIGRILGASGFNDGVFCRWWIVTGDQWKLQGGSEKGQTQTDTSAYNDGTAIWSHPIDVYYEFSGIRNWPKMSFEVWEHDSLGRIYLSGYGFCNLPTSPGNHDIDVELWKPIGNVMEELTSNLMGGSPHIRNQEIVHKPNDRFRLNSGNSGRIHLNISLILGRVTQFQVDF